MTFSKLFILGTFTCLGIFLFVSAPPKLPDATDRHTEESSVDIKMMFNVANALNEAARSIFTKDIVGMGKQAGLQFGEDWDEPGVEKGPLPALFLRLVARQLERKPEPLGLYLGSDEPINKSNLFSTEQMQQFSQVKATLLPQFDLMGTNRAIAMYPDFASSQPCVDCHNKHGESPKTDWKLGDVMGATTWTYPKVKITNGNVLSTSRALAEAVAEAYGQYLDKTKTFEDPIMIGTQWPGPEARTLPDTATFMAAIFEKAGQVMTKELLSIN